MRGMRNWSCFVAISCLFTLLIIPWDCEARSAISRKRVQEKSSTESEIFSPLRNDGEVGIGGGGHKEGIIHPVETSTGSPPKWKNERCFSGALYNETQKCYSLGTSGPCGDSREFIADESNPGYGLCACKYASRDNNCLGKPVAYWEPTKRCYPLYERGPCNEGFWLVEGDEKEKYFCQKSDCVRNIPDTPEHLPPSTNFTFSFFFDSGDCLQTFTKGVCETGLVMIFAGNINDFMCVDPIVPTVNCFLDPSTMYGISVSGSLPCQEGERRTSSGSCAPVAII